MKKESVTNSLWFLLGFLVFFNFYIVILPFEKPPRVTDIIGCLVTMFVLLRLNIVMEIKFHIFDFLYLVAISLWLMKDLLIIGPSSLIITFRWIIAFMIGLVIARVPFQSTYRYKVMVGMVCGAAANIVVILLQINGNFDSMVALGLGSRDSWYANIGSSIRYAGLFEYPNALALVTSISLPLSLGLVQEFRKPFWVVIVGFCITALGCGLTYTRAPFIVSCLLMLIWLLNGQKKQVIRNVMIICAIMSIILLFGLPGGEDRWSDSVYIENNKNDRLSSNMDALELLVKNPFGLGALFKDQVNFAVHNAYLQLGLMAGIPFLGFTIFQIFRAIQKSFFLKGSELWVALTLALNFFFEEHLTNPTIVILIMWIVFAPKSRLNLEIDSLNKSKPIGRLPIR
ncbi:O-antigen ligase family protein [Pelosinus sp. IPA-1]|uniref:O-antigen ligase family protein n=1 Tax=Pelosinus sp. IPA-1 TaxID=3029569 RepID=UPI00243617A7|nr:O-antigen ligase family protein [Pelosinus sp. IPA-1]GMB01659.1 hypothetical protein PIPA1_44590 [Pelosinus sp. IPA-1]